MIRERIKNQREQSDVFDFSKPVQSIAQKAERTTYKKIAFLTIGLAFWTSIGITLGHDISSYFTKSDQQEVQQKQIDIQTIKKMNDHDFQSFLQYLNSNQNNYDEIVGFVQDSIAKAETASYQDTMSTREASNIGTDLDSYKKRITKDTFIITKTRENILHNIHASQNNMALFLKYYNFYQSHVLIRDQNIEDDIQNLMYSTHTKDTSFFIQNHIYDQLHQLQKKFNNSQISSNNNNKNKP